MKNLTLSILTLALGCFLLQSCATDQNSSANSDSTNDAPVVETPANNNTTAPAANQTATPPAASNSANVANTAAKETKTLPAKAPTISKKAISTKKEPTRKVDAKQLLKANKQLTKGANKEELLKQTKKNMNPNLVRNIIDAYKKRGAALATSLCACSQKTDPAACKTKMTERVQKMKNLLKDDNLAAFNRTYEAGMKACK